MFRGEIHAAAQVCSPHAYEQPGRRVILGHTIKLKMHDKAGPLKALRQRLGLFVEKVEFGAE